MDERPMGQFGSRKSSVQDPIKLVCHDDTVRQEVKGITLES